MREAVWSVKIGAMPDEATVAKTLKAVRALLPSAISISQSGNTAAKEQMEEESERPLAHE
jgi:hypothetical protein